MRRCGARRSARLAVLGLLALLSGCASNRAVKCDGRLEPINPPPPKVALPAPAPAPAHAQDSPAQTSKSPP